MRKMEKFIKLLNDIILEINREKNNSYSPWQKTTLEDTVEPEMKELLKHAQKGEVY